MFLKNPAFAEEENIFYFTGTVSANTTITDNSWYIWNKPPGIQFVNIVCIGGGSGGSSGGSGSGALGGGGGGGAGTSIATYSSRFIPDALYIRPGIGGNGRTFVAANSGTPGGISYVSIEPDTAISYRLIYANGGGTNTTSFSGASNAALIANVASCPLITQAKYTFFAGSVGAAGAATAGGSVSTLVGNITTGGAGGSGATSGGGGNITGAGLYPTISGGTRVDGVGTSGSGRAGLVFWKPFMLSGGSGGAGNLTNSAGANGGNGGEGAYGCGGGGGGGVRSSTHGAGGDGGPGLVIISCW